MTEADAGFEGGPAARDQPSAGLEGLIDEVARSWKRAARSGRLAMSGDYSLNDATADWEEWVASSTRYAVRLADELWGRPAPLSLYAGTWATEMTVLPDVTKRPIRLRTDGLRARGTDIRIDPSDVMFDPDVIPEGRDTFKVSVWMGNVPTDRTLSFVGEIVDADTGEPVCNRIHANNRDGGSVR